jgi:hypothetical protein
MIRRCGLLVALVTGTVVVAGCVADPSDREETPADVGGVFAEPTPQPSPSSCADAGQLWMARAPRGVPTIPVAAPGSEQPPAPVAARGVYEFASSVGVNVHTTYNNTPYGDHDRVAGALRRLGIRHIRDGLVADRDHDQYPFLRRLADEGICAGLIVGDATAAPDQLGAMFDDLEQVAPAVELIEGPNESDLALGERWSTRLASYQARLAERVKRTPPASGVPLAAPSFGRMSSLRAAADLPLAHDVANIHPYPGGGPPSQHLSENIAAAGITEDTPAVATEHGYHNALASTVGQPGVPEDVAAVYVPRVFLESFAAGVDRTYLYELIDQFDNPQDDDAEAQYGLLRNDFSEKAAGAALRNLLTVLEAHNVHPHTTGSLPVRVESGASDVTALLLQGADGTWWVALWRQVSVYDPERQRRDDIAAVAATVVLDRPVDATVFRPGHGTDPQRRVRSRAVAVDVHADPVLIAIRPGDT